MAFSIAVARWGSYCLPQNPRPVLDGAVTEFLQKNRELVSSTSIRSGRLKLLLRNRGGLHITGSAYRLDRSNHPDRQLIPMESSTTWDFLFETRLDSASPLHDPWLRVSRSGLAWSGAMTTTDLTSQ